LKPAQSAETNEHREWKPVRSTETSTKCGNQ